MVDEEIVVGMDHVNHFAENNGLLREYKYKIKLQLACGTAYLKEHINLDIRRGGNVRPDKQMDVLDLDKHFKPESVGVIQMHHIIEHFTFREGMFLLKQVFNTLEKDGLLVLSCPDLFASCQLFTKHPDQVYWKWTLFGAQKNPYDVHKSGYTFESMKSLLERLGFRDVRRQKLKGEWSHNLLVTAKK